MTITEHVHNQSMHYHTTAILKGGKWTRVLNGEEIPEEEFKQLYPVDCGKLENFKTVNKGLNPDKTRVI